MDTHRPILVPLDGSPKGESALPFALSVARRRGSRLLLAAVERPIPVSHRHVLLEEVRWARKYLEDVKGRVRATGFENVDAALLAGDVVPALEAYAERADPALVVIATHGRGALSRIWLGSVTDRLIRRSRWPILVVRPVGEEGPSSLEREPQLARFLVTMDGSTTSEAALEPVLLLRETLGAHVVLLRVVEFPPEDPPPFYTGPGPIDPAILDALNREAESYVERLEGELRSRAVPVTGLVRVGRRAADAILEACSEQAIDLIAMGTRGLGGIGRVMLGSVADKVVRSATVPVLLVRHDAAE